MPAGDGTVEPISYRQISQTGHQKASGVVTAAGSVKLEQTDQATPLMEPVEQTYIPAETVIHKRIQ